MADIKTGGEVDAYCTRCKMVLAHTVIAIWAGQIKRIRCNTCMGEHGYRRAEPSASPTTIRQPRAARAAAPKTAAAQKVGPSGYETMLTGKDRSTARRYSPGERFSPGDLIEHPSFGLGVVAAARGFDKVDVAFPGGVKTLIHNKGSAPTFAKPPAPKAPDVEVPEEREEDPTAETSDE